MAMGLAMARLMIVDDDPGTLFLLEDFLTSNGHQVVTSATSGEGSLLVAEIHKPDLVLMDVSMPGEVDGIEAARILRKKMGIPSIIITAYVDQARRDKTRDLQICGFLTKPVSLTRLLSTIDTALAELGVH